MALTKLEYLSTRNTTLEIRANSPSTYTNHDDWNPVESISNLAGFTYDDLTRRFRDELAQKIDPLDNVAASEEAGHNIINDEIGLSILLGATNITTVSRALPKPLFLAPGSRTTATQNVRPDWGAGNETLRYHYPERVCLPLVCGDTKLNWNVYEAVEIINKGNYEDESADRRNVVKPFEQIQHYCTTRQTCWGFILTDRNLTIVRLKLSPLVSSGQSRQTRQKTFESHHRRILSDSSTATDLSDTLSSMSFRPRPQDADIGSLEIVIIPWQHKSQQLSVNLALFFLVLLASESRELSHSYNPLLHNNTASTKTVEQPPLLLQQTATRKRRLGADAVAEITTTGNRVTEYFLPAEDIDPQIMSSYIQKLIPGASFNETHKGERRGYLIKTAEQIDTNRWKEVISRLKEETRRHNQSDYHVRKGGNVKEDNRQGR